MRLILIIFAFSLFLSGYSEVDAKQRGAFGVGFGTTFLKGGNYDGEQKLGYSVGLEFTIDTSANNIYSIVTGFDSYQFEKYNFFYHKDDTETTDCIYLGYKISSDERYGRLFVAPSVAMTLGKSNQILVGFYTGFDLYQNGRIAIFAQLGCMGLGDPFYKDIYIPIVAGAQILF